MLGCIGMRNESGPPQPVTEAGLEFTTKSRLVSNYWTHRHSPVSSLSISGEERNTQMCDSGQSKQSLTHVNIEILHKTTDSLATVLFSLWYCLKCPHT